MRLESALPAGSDPRRRARQLARAREAVLVGDQPSIPLRPVIAESWDRARRGGVDPERGGSPEAVPFEEIERRRRDSGLAEVLDMLRGGLLSVAGDAQHLMVIADADGRLLWREGSTLMRRRAENLGFTEGASWDEATVGTNGIGTGLVVRRPVQLFAAEHFVRTHHPWACTAAPLHDPADGRLLGIVNVSGPADLVHPSTLALVNAVTLMAQAYLGATHTLALDRLRTAAVPLLARIGGPALVVDRNGWVVASAKLSVGDRILLPESLEGPLVWIPALGPCRVEPFFDSWLLRVGPGEGGLPTTVRLDLRSDPPRMVVVSPSGVWEHRLSLRHAEVLFLMVLHPEGRNATGLSLDLFGDRAHAAAVRATISRLRRSVGSLLEQEPNRFAPWLEVTCELPDDLVALLPSSTAPAIRAIRAARLR